MLHEFRLRSRDAMYSGKLKTKLTEIKLGFSQQQSQFGREGHQSLHTSSWKLNVSKQYLELYAVLSSYLSDIFTELTRHASS